MTTDASGLAPVSFDRLSNLFLELQSYQSPSELHGLLCGQYCAGQRPAHGAWLSTAAEHMAVSQVLDTAAKSVLIQLYDETLAKLQSEDYSFQPLLPDDDEALEQRTQALGQWCQGFLSGYGLSGRSQNDLSEEAASILADFASIAQVQFDDLEDSESSEKDFLEVSEYLRMATLMLFGECSEAEASATSGSLH
ncbi:YecA family protein [Kistimonas scapharcae]|uniref:YecA family protein n=1 Tax=Kistimonas scapharcae TaxID=1036133 RepID=A0ABP8V4T3_9GAMM